MAAGLRSRLYRWGNHPIARGVSSIRLTVVGLLGLFGLVLAGTLYQVDHGIFAAQQRFFHSWFVMAGPLPVPGAQLLFWVLGVNLIAALLFRVRMIWTNTGLIIIHVGLLLLLLGGLQTHHFARHTVLGLSEGDETSVSVDPLTWELYLAEGEDLAAVRLHDLRPGSRLTTPRGDLQLRVIDIMENSRARLDQGGGVESLEAADRNREANLNIPGLILEVRSAGEAARDAGSETGVDTRGTSSGVGVQTAQTVALHGSQTRPALIAVAGRPIAMRLGRAAHPLPARVRLLDFQAEFYPGSDIPKSFQSHLVVTEGGVSREAHISMNRPLRLRGHTFYQTSYGIDPSGRVLSVLAVVRNPGRLIPYLSSFLIFAGLLIHPLLRREEKV
jgi:hypothetical protein